MTGAERGFLLLTSPLGNPARRTLTPAQLRLLAQRVRTMEQPVPELELEEAHLVALGYGRELARRIWELLQQEDQLDYYLSLAAVSGCIPVTRANEAYPPSVHRALADDAPGCLWAKGETGILQLPRVALVGSRDLQPSNAHFARLVGQQAARQGYALVSGNARGADRIAQEACLAAGGWVISVVADRLQDQPLRSGMLYLSEDSFDADFSAQRALSRNRVIHALGGKTFVAQCGYGKGGTWDGTVKNLRYGYSAVYCFADGSPAQQQLVQMGAAPVEEGELADFSALPELSQGLFE